MLSSWAGGLRRAIVVGSSTQVNGKSLNLGTEQQDSDFNLQSWS